MRIAWVLVAVLGCKGKEPPPRPDPIARELDLDTGDAAVIAPAPNAEPANEPANETANTPPGDAAPPVNECIGIATVESWDPVKQRACFDNNLCVTWKRGALDAFEVKYTVEDDDAEPAEPAPDFRTDDNDTRIHVDADDIQICPPDRACMRIVPDVGDGELQLVVTDPGYKRGVFVMREAEAHTGALEIWDLAAGRRKARVPYKRLDADDTYELSAQLGSGAVIALATASNDRTLGTVLSLDGGLRGELAQGSPNLDLVKSFRAGGLFGIVDVGPPDNAEAPYVLHLVSLASGAAVGKLVIKRESTLSLDVLPNGFVALTQFGEHTRIDMLDLRTRRISALVAPGC